MTIFRIVKEQIAIIKRFDNSDLPNLKLFSREWSSIEYGDVVISGVEILNENAQSIYSTLSLKEDKCNIVMLHGQEGEGMGVDKVNLTKLRDKFVDYLALGHIHEYKSGKIDTRGTYAQSGCLEGRGFDETGAKGFVLLEVDDVVKSTFVPFAQRTIHEFMVDLTDSKNKYVAYQAVK